MKRHRFWHHIWPWSRTRKVSPSSVVSDSEPLREFVYLDEISVKSLLASQQGELKADVTEHRSVAQELEATGKATFGPPGVGVEAGSRYQVGWSSERQTLRKVVAQSQFKELRDLDQVAIAFKGATERQIQVASFEHLEQQDVVSVDQLERGRLVELEVELEADPIYRFSAMMSEMSDLAEKYPDMVQDPDSAALFGQMGPINRVLQQLLAGLVPIRARCTNLVHVEIAESKYVISRDVAVSLDLEWRSIEVVGVAELDLFWKDVRRVLFSHGKFKMLCRVARPGLHQSWSAVKGADVLTEILPAFPAMLDAVGRQGYTVDVDTRELKQRRALNRALHIVVNHLESKLGRLFSEEEQSLNEALIDVLELQAATPDGQRRAFDALMQHFVDSHDLSFQDGERSELRSAARAESGLQFSLEMVAPATATELQPTPPSDDLLLDVDIIAIYW